jgi:hypothetical protein
MVACFPGVIEIPPAVGGSITSASCYRPFAAFAPGHCRGWGRYPVAISPRNAQMTHAEHEVSLVRGLLRFRGRGRNGKVIVDAEDPGSRVGLDAGNGLVSRIVDDAVESNVPIFHDNVDGMEAPRWIICDATRHQCDAATPGSHRLRDTALVGVIFPQTGLRINAVVNGGTNTVVVRRIRENFDLVVNRLYSGYALENVGCATLEGRTRGIAFENDCLAMEAEGNPVEDAIVGEAAEPLLHLFDDTEPVVLRPGRRGALSNDGWNNKAEDKSSRK